MHTEQDSLPVHATTMNDHAEEKVAPGFDVAQCRTLKHVQRKFPLVPQLLGYVVPLSVWHTLATLCNTLLNALLGPRMLRAGDLLVDKVVMTFVVDSMVTALLAPLVWPTRLVRLFWKFSPKKEATSQVQAAPESLSMKRGPADASTAETHQLVSVDYKAQLDGDATANGGKLPDVSTISRDTTLAPPSSASSGK
ncbi:uncharacterized protein KNAG_0J02570 [Huiozyma naganishii CBS 8797]|uniref:Uncharacterized protein n=1 Tax=Huiozyma naganishii (strain ATCC MYA-139 / BCRC 22969 / CBS 8797 / KCTC 17520 / NBRC 10181 / NCYC 3082 / Yp74L-3) TaxID=1071383 RepID=J7SAN7_HUIN7|nr:hypothetical protein KNAG_0J02570 [Kazachstania naganishii CBS 8797]CCK72336.1 hypothetical protein KNAG_0J02570 [Kazachstania naganishii CBS 8797]